MRARTPFVNMSVPSPQTAAYSICFRYSMSVPCLYYSFTPSMDLASLLDLQSKEILCLADIYLYHIKCRFDLK